MKQSTKSRHEFQGVFNQTVEKTYRDLLDQLNYANDSGDLEAFLEAESKLRVFLQWLSE